MTKGLDVNKGAMGAKVGGLRMPDRGPRTRISGHVFPSGMLGGCIYHCPRPASPGSKGVKMRLTAGPGPGQLIDPSGGPGLRKVGLRSA